MKFLIDNAISPAFAVRLRQIGHDAVHARDYGLHAAEDSVVLAPAAAEERILVSKDTDFGDLLAESGAKEPSFILFRTASGEPDRTISNARSSLAGRNLA